MAKAGCRVLFLYANPRQMSLVPPVVGLFASILHKHGHKMYLFDTSLYDVSSQYVDADKFKQSVLTVKSYDKKLEQKRGALRPFCDLIPDLIKIVNHVRPDIIMTTAVESTFLFTESILKQVRMYDIPVLLGGVFATFASELAINSDAIDMLCVGEGEQLIVDMCDRIINREELDGLDNLWIKKNDGTIRKGSLAAPFNINTDLVPDMSVFDSRRFYRAMAGKIYKMFPIETHRGCPHTCTFCNSPLQNQIYWDKTQRHFFRKKEIKYVRKEVEQYFKKYNAEYFFFWADNFMAYSEREIDEFCEFYGDIRVPFYVQSNPFQLSEYKLKKLKVVGLHRVGIGVEHGNEHFRKTIIKRLYSNDLLLRGVRYLHKYDIPFSANNICGFPLETPELVFDTIELNRAIKPHTTGCSIFTPFHGTPLRQLSLEHGFLSDPNVIAPSNSETSILDMPQFTKDQIYGKSRTFNLYVQLPKKRWPDIKQAESISEEGNKIWNELRSECIEKEKL